MEHEYENEELAFDLEIPELSESVAEYEYTFDSMIQDEQFRKFCEEQKYESGQEIKPDSFKLNIIGDKDVFMTWEYGENNPPTRVGLTAEVQGLVSNPNGLELTFDRQTIENGVQEATQNQCVLLLREDIDVKNNKAIITFCEQNNLPAYTQPELDVAKQQTAEQNHEEVVSQIRDNKKEETE